MKILIFIGVVILVNALSLFRWFLLDNVRLKPKVFAAILIGVNLLLVLLFVLTMLG